MPVDSEQPPQKSLEEHLNSLMLKPQYACRYLGAKLKYGHQPLYTSGLDETAKRFGSLHAVQRHMIDSNKCTICYDGNEDEYEDYYEYPCAF